MIHLPVTITQQGKTDRKVPLFLHIWATYNLDYLMLQNSMNIHQKRMNQQKTRATYGKLRRHNKRNVKIFPSICSEIGGERLSNLLKTKKSSSSAKGLRLYIMNSCQAHDTLMISHVWETKAEARCKTTGLSKQSKTYLYMRSNISSTSSFRLSSNVLTRLLAFLNNGSGYSTILRGDSYCKSAAAHTIEREKGFQQRRCITSPHQIKNLDTEKSWQNINLLDHTTARIYRIKWKLNFWAD